MNNYIKQCKPKEKGKSDKYSWNLYRYFERNPEMCKVHYHNYTDKYNEKTREFEKVFKAFDVKDFNVRNIMVSYKNKYDNAMHGKYVTTICGDSKDRYQNVCLLSHKDEWEDITEIFWESYIKYGRCFLFGHDAWLTNEEDRFTYVNNTRKCNWCGKWQRLTIEKQVKITRKRVWI